MSNNFKIVQKALHSLKPDEMAPNFERHNCGFMNQPDSARTQAWSGKADGSGMPSFGQISLLNYGKAFSGHCYAFTHTFPILSPALPPP
jgi:hypothetical protein